MASLNFGPSVAASVTGTGSITGGGTVATGGFTLTVPATGTAALTDVAQTFTKTKTLSPDDDVCLRFGDGAATFRGIGNTAGYSSYFDVGTANFRGSNGAAGGIVRVGKLEVTTNESGPSNLFKGTDVASDTAIVPTGNLFHVTGTNAITSITATGCNAGTQITIIFDGVLTFTDGNNLKLAGDFVTTADDTITLVYDGSNWYEVCRSVN